MGGLEWWHWVIIIGVAMVLFGGYKKLPSASKSIAQSLKIFKEETKGLVSGDDKNAPETAVPVESSEHTTAATGGGAIPAPVTIAAPQPVSVPAAPAQEPVAPPVIAAPGSSLAPKPHSR